MTTDPKPAPRTLEEIVRAARLLVDGPGRTRRDLDAIEALVCEAASRASPEAPEDCYPALCEAERKLSESRTENARLEALIYAERAARAFPEEGRALRPEVLAFAHAMEAKLRRHDGDRGSRGWSVDSAESLMARLCQEVEELDAAWRGKHSPDGVLSEAADVGNFAMMIADVAGVLRSPPLPREESEVGYVLRWAKERLLEACSEGVSDLPLRPDMGSRCIRVRLTVEGEEGGT